MLKYYHKKAVWLILFILWSLLLIFVTVYPDSSKVIIQTSSGFRWDYLEHFLAYFIFGTLYILWRGDDDFGIRGTELAFLLSVTCAFSILTEYIQVLIPGRSFNVIDMLYNLFGVLAGILAIYFLFMRVYLRRKYAGH